MTTCRCGRPTRDAAYVCDECPRCAVCSSPLPAQTGPGRPRKVCRDEDSPTPGGCARWRDIELSRHRWARLLERRSNTTTLRVNLEDVFPNGGYTVE